VRGVAVAVAVCLLAVLWTAGAPAAKDGEDGARLPGTAATGVYPALRRVTELGLPEARLTDAGVGVYPALSAPATLAFPSPGAIEAARRFAESRLGRVSFAVADPRAGVTGLRLNEPYTSASLVKAMLLVAYLERVEKDGSSLSPAEVSRLDAMIRVSDNDSASAVYRRLGAGALTSLARRVGMRSFQVRANWADARVTAADQAQFFVALDRLFSTARQRDYARYLLSSVAPFHSWGIPQAARPRWQVFFKGGWRPQGGGQLIHQGALLERGPRRVAIAVLTDGNPSEPYGHETVRGIAERLLRPPSPADEAAAGGAAPGRLAPVESLEGYRPPRPRRLRPLPAVTS
jgi:beta-lactamase class A